MPFARQTDWPITVAVAKVPTLANMLTELAFNEEIDEPDAFTKLKLVIVPVAELKMLVVSWLPDAVVKPSVVIVPFVANKFVEKLFVEVVFPKNPFQRLEAMPNELARSVVGTRSDEKRPPTVMASVVSLPSVMLPKAAKVDVTDEEAATKPENN
jgi:hypothetical protein